MTEPLLYARKPKRPRSGQFSGLYVTVGAIGLLVGGGLFVFDGLTFSLVWAAWGQFGGGRIWFPIHLLGPLLFGILCDVLIFSGALMSLWKFPWARQLARAGSAGELVFGAFYWLAFFRGPMAGGGPQFVMGFTALVVGRGFFALLLYVAYSNIRADFYFKKIGDGVVLEQVPIVPIEKPKGRPKGRFLVTGIDRVTRKETSYISNALTEDSAVRAALTLGLEAATVKVQPIEGRGEKSNDESNQNVQ